MIALLLNENASITPAALPHLVQSCINTVGLQRSSERETQLETLLVVSISICPIVCVCIRLEYKNCYDYCMVKRVVINSFCILIRYDLEIRRGFLVFFLWNLQAALNLDTEKVLGYVVNHSTPISPLCRVHSAALMWNERTTRSSWHQVAPEIGCSLMEHYCIQLAFRTQYQQSAFEYLMGCPRSKTYAIISRLDANWVRI